MPLTDYRFVFVLTYARSGSTLLQSILNSAPGVQIRGENNNALYHVFQCIRAVQRSKHDHGQQVTTVDGPWYGADKLTPMPFKSNMLNLFVNGVLKPDPQAKILGFKEIRHIPFYMTNDQFNQYCTFILNSFPDAKIIFNSRNAEDVAESGWFKDQNSAGVAQNVIAADDRFRVFDENSDRTIHLDYDKYVQDHSEIEKLFRFLDFDYDRDRIEQIFSRPLTHGKTSEK